MERLLFVFGVLAMGGASLTHLRFPGLPAGVPEVLGALFIVGRLSGRQPLHPAYWQVLGLAALMLVGVLVGSLNNLMLGSLSTNLNQDLLAVAYAIVLAVLLGNAVIDDPRRILAIGRGLALAMALHTVPLVAGLAGADVGTSGWTGDTELARKDGPTTEERLDTLRESEALTDKANRYQGFSTNPNQLAAATSLGALLFAWIGLTVRGALMPAWLVLAVASFGLLILTKSSTAILGVCLAAVFMLVRRLAAREDERGVAHYPLVLLVITWALLTPILLALQLFLDRAIEGRSGGGDASGRFELWRESIEGIIQSNFLGVGPGAHAGFGAPFQNEEAHNIFLDLALQGGLLSVLAFVLLLWLLYRRTVAGHTAIGVALFILAVTLGMAHYLLRHPAYWLMLCLPCAINHYYSRPARLWRAERREARHRSADALVTTAVS